MPDFRNRSYQKELLDGDDIPFPDIKRNMEELDRINSLLGGHAISIAGLRRLAVKGKLQDEVEICEIGCGGGDNLRVLRNWCRKNNMPARFRGIDINPHCIDYARSKEENKGIQFTCGDYRNARLEAAPRIIFSSLFCHHFPKEELVHLLQWCRLNAPAGFFINDLHRHPVAYYSIKWLTSLFSGSYLVRNDAPLSVLRGFHKNEWEELLDLAGISGAVIYWKWAFRWLILAGPEKNNERP